MWLHRIRIFYILVLVFIQQQASVSIKPNIIIILADDLGWNDVGFHGSNQIPTPNIDALAYTGIILNNYYVAPICTPSRSALLTGKYPIHTGMQHGVILGGEPWGLGLDETILPQYLKKTGYVTKAVGKWHLGHFKHEYLPEERGFDSHYGYWTGNQDYYDHTALEEKVYWGYDMRRGMNITWSDYGQYTTDLLTNEAVKLIKHHDTSKPLFLYIAHLAVHSANRYNPLQAPLQTISKFNYIENKNRRLFAGMLSKLDDSIGSVVEALGERDMLKNSIIIFSTDNGGPANGFDLNAASNWPLRGVKDTLWEGGVRGAGFVWSPLLPSSKVSNALIHITDWLPTLLFLTNTSIPENLDGVNVWHSLFDEMTLVRKEILLNIDPKRNISALRHGKWKYIKGNSNDWNGWYGPSGRNYKYNWTQLYNSSAVKAINNIRALPEKSIIKRIRELADFKCLQKDFDNGDINTSEIYLFDLERDPCEKENLASNNSVVVSSMEARLQIYMRTMVPPRNQPLDPRSNPKYWGYTWLNWLDFLGNIEQFPFDFQKF